MSQYRWKYQGARRHWLDLAEEEANHRNLEFQRDTEEEAFIVPDEIVVRVRASLDQAPRIALGLGEELEIRGHDSFSDYDKVILIVLNIHNQDAFDVEVDDFIPVRESLLTNEKHVTERSNGRMQLNINIEDTPFQQRKNEWDWVF